MDDLSVWIQERAKELRKVQTPQEIKLWCALKAKRFSGFKFRRQEVIARYIVDFVCYEKNLIVELDGSQHLDQEDYDQNRDAWLREQGFRVLRLWNYQIDKSFDDVLEAIFLELNFPSP